MNHVILQNHVTNYSYYISTTTMPMTTKPGRGVTCHEGLPRKSHGYIIMLSWRSRDKLKSYIHYYKACGYQACQGGSMY